MYDTTTKEMWYSGTNAGNSSKTFVIDHPKDENKYLVHACLEGPESGVYYRGRGEITNNESTTIYLPDYVEALATDFTIQITPIRTSRKSHSSCEKEGKVTEHYAPLPLPLEASEIENNSFIVYGNNSKFYWLVQGKRSDIDVEPLKQNVDVKGNGPYRWI